MLKFNKFLVLLVICFWSIDSLPVKESTTKKDPNANTNEEENPSQNLENIIGNKFCDTSHFFHHH
jgi:hypothetical protein